MDQEAMYWKEDADRVNELCRVAREMGITVPTGPLKPPLLNTDGSEVDSAPDDEKSWDDEKFNPNHNNLGRFSSGPGGGILNLAPDTGGGGGGNNAAGVVGASKDKEGRWKLDNGKELPDHVPRIPPAWTNVKVNTNPKAELVVVGLDSKNRKQFVYSEAHWKKAAETKFARIQELRKKLKGIDAEIDNDMDSPDPVKKECAHVAKLINATGIRPGSNMDTGAEKQAYGATTLEGRHVKVGANEVRLQFVGKKGVDLDIPVTDPKLVKVLKDRKQQAGPKGQLFQATDSQLRGYMKDKDGGGFKPKDLRTAKGTNEAVDKIKTMDPPMTMTEYKKKVKEVAKHVAGKLGNTPTIALQSYIDPSVFAGWRVKS